MTRHLFIKDEMPYDGTQLAPHWIYKNFGILGDCITAFTGPCHVKLDKMVDLEDVMGKAHIYSPLMLHFIAEFFGPGLPLTISLQRLLIVAIKEELEDRAVPGRITRRGDDLYHIGIADVVRKLTVSIATLSTVSGLIHTGVNIHTQGTPVPAAGLSEMGVDPKPFAEKVMERFIGEIESMNKAACKVRAL
jgi:hypothetical protein